MTLELLTSSEASKADRLTMSDSRLGFEALVERAGAAGAAVALERYPSAARIHVLCGPGNNGADGRVAARVLSRAGVTVRCWFDGSASDAEPDPDLAKSTVLPLAAFDPAAGDVVIDALYGAGLARPLGPHATRAIDICDRLALPCLSVDLPSGVEGDSGRVASVAFHASCTVTFVRKKPGHLLYPGRAFCGDVVVADIGIGDAIIDALSIACFENAPGLWQAFLPRHDWDVHKYSRGHVGVFSGGPASTGAARLSAMGAARVGAGAVTLLSPGGALATNAAQLTSTIVHRVDTLEDFSNFAAERKPRALVFGPGRGTAHPRTIIPLDLIRESGCAAVIFDADALTMIAEDAGRCFEAAKSEGAPALTLTPHEGEFARVFPDIASDLNASKLEKARRAAALANAILVYKGPDTVIASPDGRAAINGNGTPLLATAGTGDVLAGIIAGLSAQGMPPFEAACAAVWMHAQAARRIGPGLIAEDLPQGLMAVLGELLAKS